VLNPIWPRSAQLVFFAGIVASTWLVHVLARGIFDRARGSCSCSAPLERPFAREPGLGRCQRCGAVVSARRSTLVTPRHGPGRPRFAWNSWKRDEHDPSTVRRRWLDERVRTNAIIGAALVLIISVALTHSAKGFAVGALIVAYFGGAIALNSTRISVTADALRVRRGPVPGWSGLDLERSRIEELVLASQKIRNGREEALYAAMNDGTFVQVAVGRPPELAYLRRRLERAMHLVPPRPPAVGRRSRRAGPRW
jgi:hypothetical protein